MKQKYLFLSFFLLVLLFPISGNLWGSVIAKGKKSNTLQKNENVASSSKVMITNNAKYGKILTDGNGMSLYFFVNDNNPNTSACNGACSGLWPHFYADSLTIGPGLDSADFSTITRADSKKQTTYKGWPLYYFSGDSKSGDVNGEGFKGIWFVAKPNYTIMLMNNQLVGKNGVNYNGNYQPGTGTVQYFVDSYGHTLYYFTHDSFDKNTFTNSNFSNSSLWAIYQDSLQAVPLGVDSSYFGTINVYGREQLTYKGWPLYEFGPDSMKRGNTKGVSFPSPGVWPVAQTSIDSAKITGISSYNSISGIPSKFSLSQNYPDPFNPSTTIKFSIVKPEKVTLKIYNSLGQVITELVNKELSAGFYTVTWNAIKQPSGVYFYSINTPDFRQVKKMILLK